MLKENGKGEWEKKEKGGNSSGGGGGVLRGGWKGQLDSLQAAIAQNYTPHSRSLRCTLRRGWRFEFHY